LTGSSNIFAFSFQCCLLLKEDLKKVGIEEDGIDVGKGCGKGCRVAQVSTYDLGA
jgi:hypothetical protein